MKLVFAITFLTLVLSVLCQAYSQSSSYSQQSYSQSSAPYAQSSTSYSQKYSPYSQQQTPYQSANQPWGRWGVRCNPAYRYHDAICNNLNEPLWGWAGDLLVRKEGWEYVDHAWVPVYRGNERYLSNLLFDNGYRRPARYLTAEEKALGSNPDKDNNLNNFFVMFGQWLTHEILWTPTVSKGQVGYDKYKNYQIPVTDKNDMLYDPAKPYLKVSPSEGAWMAGRFYPWNNNTAFIDCSSVYGSTEEDNRKLRSYRDGKLKTSPTGDLPYQKDIGVRNECYNGGMSTGERYHAAGDLRCNENVALNAMHNILLREHNRLCDQIKSAYPNWGDEAIYQKARKTLIAKIQHIVYNEYLPTLLLKGNQYMNHPQYYMSPYNGYQQWVHPGIWNVFASAAFRFGHDMQNLPLLIQDEKCNVINAPLINLNYNPTKQTLYNGGVQVMSTDDADVSHMEDNSDRYVVYPDDDSSVSSSSTTSTSTTTTTASTSASTPASTPASTASSSSSTATVSSVNDYTQSSGSYQQSTPYSQSSGSYQQSSSKQWWGEQTTCLANFAESIDKGKKRGTAVMRGMLRQYAQCLDGHMDEWLRNILTGPYGSANMDIEATHLYRGRLHGLPDYHTIRVWYGGQSVFSYSQCKRQQSYSQNGYSSGDMDSIECFLVITGGNQENAAKLQKAYRHVDNIDALAGLLYEAKEAGLVLPPTLTKIIALQFKNIRDGDRWWFENTQNGLFTASEISEIKNCKLGDLILANTDLSPSEVNVNQIFRVHAPCSTSGKSY